MMGWTHLYRYRVKLGILKGQANKKDGETIHKTDTRKTLRSFCKEVL